MTDSVFKNLELLPPIEAPHLTILFEKSTDKNKVDLGAGGKRLILCFSIIYRPIIYRPTSRYIYPFTNGLNTYEHQLR